jgi:peptidoglycan/LPS O-acetylase OafA/YrhL
VAASTAQTRVPWNLDRGRPSGEMGYLPGLDGLRAVAVLGVLLYHADLAWMPGGFLGVDVFFVLSGFLITTLILEEIDRSGLVDFKRFYIRRARRLLPALLLVLAVVAIMAAFWIRDAASGVRTDGLASLFYVTNWWYVVADQSYFEFIGRPALLKHLWSLAVEEQFYLLWPVAAWLLMRWKGRKGVAGVAAAVALLSTLWMTFLSIRNGYPDLADPSRVYFGTDSHAMGLLVGAALATAWRPGRLSARVPGGSRALITGVGIGALLLVLWFFWQVGEFTPWLYRSGGFLVLSLIVAVLIAAATHPASPLGGWMGTQPWRYLGERSYGLYLWHWPIFMVTRPGLDVPIEGFANLVLRFGLTIGVAELSYRFIELPIRHGAIGRWWARWQQSSGELRAALTRRALVVGSVVVLSLGVVGGALATAPAPSAEAGMAADVAAAIGVADGGPTEVSIEDQLDDPTPQPSRTGKKNHQTVAPTDPTVPPRNRNGTMTAVGDSVLLGARVTLQRVIDGTKVDAAVGRQAGEVLSRIQDLNGKGLMAPIVMIHTGTNGIVTEDQLRDMLRTLKDAERVVVVNVDVPRRWMDPNNEVIDKVVPEFPNAVIADWRGASAGHGEYFVSDGVHLTGPGMRAYAKLVEQAAGLA